MPSTLEQSEPNNVATVVSEQPSIAVEANLLRLPLFALHTRGLKNLDGYECRGTRTRGENTWDFLFRTARSTATMYPGPLSRSIHLAFLSLITDQGLPFANPITWKWRDLCDRMDVWASGRTVQKLKKAVEATAGLTIYSEDALYSKPTGQRLNSRKAMHLYETVVFVNETLPDGRLADKNYLWLSGWYLDNLNALFTAPLDHELWRFLDKQSPIASRLYEFLLINFYGQAPQLRINYPRLAQFLPVRPERYFSDARKQFDPALRLLEQTRVTQSVTWHRRPDDVAQLQFQRGERLLANRGGNQLVRKSADATTLIDVKEVRRTPEQELVGEFYRLWTGRSDELPRTADLLLAKQILANYGQVTAKGFLPIVIDELKRRWPGAKTFVAAKDYIGTAAEVYHRQLERDQRQRKQEEIERQAIESAERQQSERRQFEIQWQPIWDKLPEGEKAAIRSRVLTVYPFMRHTPNELQNRCLIELAKQPDKRRETDPETGERPLRTARNPQL